MGKLLISDYSVYAIRHTDELKAKFQDGGKGVFIEKRRWVDGSKLFYKAKREQKLMPVIFGRAEIDSSLIFYAMLESIQVDDEAQTTTYTFTGLTRIKKPLPLRTLIKKNDGKPLSDDYIRSYVICRTPEFIK
ncbi:MAG: hypothetical protein WBV94_27150 [Blastocatellia bacterium]